MKNLYKLAAIAFACFCILAINLPTTAQAPTPIPSVWLQPAYPGTAQTGNININGRYTSTVTQDGVGGMLVQVNGNNTAGIQTFAYGANTTGVTGQGSQYGVWGYGDGSTSAGIFGNSGSGGKGVWGSSTIGDGVVGDSNYSYGVRGTHYVGTPGIAGVYGQSPLLGVHGNATGTSGVPIGVQGDAVFATGFGVLGTNTLGVGVKGTSAAGNSAGVRGENTSTDSGADGVFGTTGSGNAAGVSGNNTGAGYGVFAQSATGYGMLGLGGGFAGVAGSGATNGLYGQTNNNGASGVYGVNGGTGWGVYGFASTTGTGVSGVNNDPAGYAVYAQGRLATTGTKLFQIDHPFDPENKYLNHFCTEGAEPLNAYSGKVTTDDKGYATVALPDYFTEINRDPRIQLTVVDDTDEFVMAKVVREPTGAEFTLRTSKPNVRVYWRVEAVRNDRWVRTYGFEVEETKPPQHRGKYLNPELFGQPKTKGQFYVAEPVVVTKK